MEGMDDITTKAKLLIDELAELDKSYFSKDRQKQLKSKLEEVTTLLD